MDRRMNHVPIRLVNGLLLSRCVASFSASGESGSNTFPEKIISHSQCSFEHWQLLLACTTPVKYAIKIYLLSCSYTTWIWKLTLFATVRKLLFLIRQRYINPNHWRYLFCQVWRYFSAICMYMGRHCIYGSSYPFAHIIIPMSGDVCWWLSCTNVYTFAIPVSAYMIVLCYLGWFDTRVSK